MASTVLKRCIGNNITHILYPPPSLRIFLGRYLACTQFEATDARRCFPCWDEPACKASFQCTLTVPSNRVAISNTDIISKSTVRRFPHLSARACVCVHTCVRVCRHGARCARGVGKHFHVLLFPALLFEKFFCGRLFREIVEP